MNAIIKRGAGLVSVLAGFGIVAAGCLTRPVTTTPPQTTSNFTAVVQNQVVDKIDLLFDIDNSASMGDKQTYLIAAIPDLINQLLNPGCVDANGDPIDDATGAPILSVAGVCPTGMGQPAFAPVHDMHLGIVTSSLGQRLSEQNAGPGSTDIICQTTQPAAGPTVGVQYPTGIAAHNDDQGHLVAREITYSADLTTATEGPVADANVTSYDTAASSTMVANWGGFLDWFPTTGSNTGIVNNQLPTGLNPVTDDATLQADFATMVGGVGIYGCGIESQLESWYRFLIQPDPYLTLAVTNNGPPAVWSGVDTTILQERHDFLRPDSLVAVIVLSDENDSEIDVRSYSGQGYYFMGADYVPVKGTSACLTNPSSGSCTNCPSGSTDPNCTAPDTYTAGNDWGQNPNLRHVHMKAKYGVDPQYPWQRYVIGLTSPTVPDRNGEYPPGFGNYDLNNNNCTNPLFASALPDPSQLGTITVTNGTSNKTLCDLPLGTARTPAAGATTSSLVFYAIIGGVPHQLLHFDPTSPEKSELSQQDWVRILGQGPANLTLTQIESVTPNAYDYTGIDPHMIEGYLDRTLGTIPTGLGLTNQGQPNPFSIQNINYDASLTTCNGQTTCANALTPATSTANPPADTVNGREWTTELPYTTATATGTTATIPYAPHVLPVDRQYACIFPLTTPRDCTNPVNNYECDCPDTATGITPDEVPPLCDPTNPTSQIYAKAYPTIRELQVARLMGLQGIVSSLCPIDVSDNATGNDPYYGYRPAVTTIINRLKNALTNQCLPEQLPTTSDSGTGEVPCLILVQMPPGGVDGGAGGSCLNPVCPASEGLSVPESDVLQKFCANQELAFTSGNSVGTDPATLSVCQLTQLTPQTDPNPNDFQDGSCAAATTPGWCYVVGAKGCAQSIVFPTNSPPAGATAFLQCIEQTISVLDGG